MFISLAVKSLMTWPHIKFTTTKYHFHDQIFYARIQNKATISITIWYQIFVALKFHKKYDFLVNKTFERKSFINCCQSLSDISITIASYRASTYNKARYNLATYQYASIILLNVAIYEFFAMFMPRDDTLNAEDGEMYYWNQSWTGEVQAINKQLNIIRRSTRRSLWRWNWKSLLWRRFN